MIQRVPLPRSTKPIRAKRRNPRRGPLRDQAYKNWLKERACVVCSRDKRRRNRDGSKFIQWGLSDPAHTLNNGMRSKGPDSSCVPLCRVHHEEYDAGRKAFEAKYGIDMQNEAKAHWAVYQLVKEGTMSSDDPRDVPGYKAPIKKAEKDTRIICGNCCARNNAEHARCSFCGKKL